MRTCPTCPKKVQQNDVVEKDDKKTNIRSLKVTSILTQPNNKSVKKVKL